MTRSTLYRHLLAVNEEVVAATRKAAELRTRLNRRQGKWLTDPCHLGRHLSVKVHARSACSRTIQKQVNGQERARLPMLQAATESCRLPDCVSTAVCRNGAACAVLGAVLLTAARWLRSLLQGSTAKSARGCHCRHRQSRCCRCCRSLQSDPHGRLAHPHHLADS